MYGKKGFSLPLFAIQRAGKEAYHIIPCHQYKIAYFPIPKNACTSSKKLMYSMMYNTESGEPEGEHIHDFFGYSAYETLQEFREYFLFAIIRDPIERFVSGFRNRILYHRDLGSEYMHQSDISDFALNIGAWRLKSRPIDQHFALQCEYLPSDLASLSQIYTIGDLDKMSADLSRRCGRTLCVQREQTGGPKVSIGELNEKALEHLLSYYGEDYELLSPFYSQDTIVQKHFAERSRICT
jgi:hypothetical protein